MAFLLDTVTVSELRKGARTDVAVKEWQASFEGVPAFLSVITMNEIRFGIGKLKGRDVAFSKLLELWYDALLAQSEVFPLLDVSLPIAELAADFRAAFQMSFGDALIAATASVHGLTLATRNTADFEQTGISFMNPWDFGK